MKRKAATTATEQQQPATSEQLLHACLNLLAGHRQDYEHLLTHGTKTDLLNLETTLQTIKARCDNAQLHTAHHITELTITINQHAGRYTQDPARGAAAQTALARRHDQHDATTYQACATLLVTDLPYLDSRSAAGDLDEPHLIAILRHLKTATPEQRRAFDQHYAAHPDLFYGLPATACGKIAQHYTHQVRSDEATDELNDAHQQRKVTITYTQTSARVHLHTTIEQGLALETYLQAAANNAAAHHDSRTPSQVKADTLVANALQPATDRPAVTAHLNLYMTDKALFLGDTEPAYLPGYGTLPAKYVRQLLIRAREAAQHPTADPSWAPPFDLLLDIRRLYTAPGDQQLVAMDSRARTFPKNLMSMITLRDRRCRTPWCTNSVLEGDHITQYALGGHTSFEEGNGRCKWCNNTKETTGWKETLEAILPHQVTISPGDGPAYTSTAPPLTGIGWNPPPEPAPASEHFTPLTPPDTPPRRRVIARLPEENTS